MKTDKQFIDKSENDINERDAHILTLVSQMVTIGIAEKIPVQEMREYIEKIYKPVSSLLNKREDFSILPAVPINRSVTDKHLICLEDGQKFNSLKKHLQSTHGMTPEEYREKWNLPEDYPMTCKDYSAIRSKLAKNVGLGTVNRLDTFKKSLKVSGKKK